MCANFIVLTYLHSNLHDDLNQNHTISYCVILYHCTCQGTYNHIFNVLVSIPERSFFQDALSCYRYHVTICFTSSGGHQHLSFPVQYIGRARPPAISIHTTPISADSPHPASAKPGLIRQVYMPQYTNHN